MNQVSLGLAGFPMDSKLLRVSRVIMIFKTKDSSNAQLEDLGFVLEKERSEVKRRALEKQRALMLAGLAGEKEAAYHIDFDLKDAANWAVIHDLRLEWNGRVAQIDHLLISRVLEVFVVESKNFRRKVRYANGGWERLNRNEWEGIPSPVEQNERHIRVLKGLISAEGLSPMRLGMPIPLDFLNRVLVNPSCSIIGTFPSQVRIYKMDSFVRAVREQSPSLLYPLKIVSPKTLEEFALKLVTYHKPAPTMSKDNPPAYRAIKGVTKRESDHFCSGCGGPVRNDEACFCRTNKARFGGSVLCRKCQTYAPSEKKTTDSLVAGYCAGCGSAVEKKVVAFSRFNSKRLGGRILCRDCQILVVKV